MRFGIGMGGCNRTQYRRWTEDEALMLQELAGDMPFPRVCQQWNLWAAREGLPSRSSESLRRKLVELGVSRRVSGSWLCVGDVARMLGKSRSTIRLWCADGLIRHHKAGPYSSVSRDDLIQLARKRPRLFAGCDRGNLLLLLEDEDLVSSILERFPRRYWGMGRGRRIRRVDTGEVFATYREAAAAAHMSDKTIIKALQNGKLACGLQYELVE